jgi:hypothetical protein
VFGALGVRVSIEAGSLDECVRVDVELSNAAVDSRRGAWRRVTTGRHGTVKTGGDNPKNALARQPVPIHRQQQQTSLSLQPIRFAFFPPSDSTQGSTVVQGGDTGPPSSAALNGE